MAEKNTSVIALATKTLPFFIARILVYVIFGVAALIFLAIMTGVGYLVMKMFGNSGGAFVIVLIITFGSIYGILRFVERYFLYMVKIGHVAVVTELLRTGEIPEGKGQIAYGKDQVTQNFGTSNVAFVMDKLVYAAVKQIQRWIIRIGNVFSFVPGSKNIIGIINAIMGVSLNYIDEAVVSYVFLRKSEAHPETVWKSASDGVVLYAQSWKGILKTATMMVVFIYAFNIIVFVIFLLPMLFISNMAAGGADIGSLYGLIAIIGASIVTTVCKRAVIDPLVTIAMIRSYQINIRGKAPAMDLQAKMLKVSNKFKELHHKGETEPDPVGPVEETSPTPV